MHFQEDGNPFLFCVSVGAFGSEMTFKMIDI